MILEPTSNAACCKSNLTSYKVIATTLRFMIEENTVTSKNAICFSVFLNHPITILLSNCVWGVRMEWSIFILWNFFNFSIQFRSRCLVNLASLIKSCSMNCLKNTKNTKCINIACVFSRIKRYLYV